MRDSAMPAPRERVPFLDLAAAHAELREALDAAYRRVMDSGRYVLGKELDAFESEFAAYCGARHCAGVGNGLDALRLILEGCGIGAGDEVIVPASTFIATWLAVTHAGARPVGVDVRADTCNLDPARVEAALTPRTRAIVAVHLYGRPAAMAPLRALASRHNLRLIEDAAQAHGAVAQGARAGALGDAAAFSFYPAKNLGACGDGGAVVSDDADLVARIRRLRNYGADAKYDHRVAGHNSRLDPLQAAFLRAKLPHLDAWNARRRAVADRYLSGLAAAKRCTLPAIEAGVEPAWHLFVVRHPRRDRLRERLAAAGIETSVHYPVPPHLTDAYAGSGWRRGDFPVSEALAATAVSLPIGPHLSTAAVERVIAAVLACEDRDD